MAAVTRALRVHRAQAHWGGIKSRALAPSRLGGMKPGQPNEVWWRGGARACRRTFVTLTTVGAWLQRCAP